MMAGPSPAIVINVNRWVIVYGGSHGKLAVVPSQGL
jgi:hypothetical protein